MEPELFSPTIRAALPDIGTELTNKLGNLDPLSETHVVLLVVSNGEVTLQSTMPNDVARDCMLEACARLAAEDDDPPEGESP